VGSSNLAFPAIKSITCRHLQRQEELERRSLICVNLDRHEPAALPRGEEVVLGHSLLLIIPITKL
jgi:hypothetical protein